MEFFKKFFVRLKSKINYFIGTFFVCFVLFLVPNVYASEMYFGINGSIDIYSGTTHYFQIGDSTNNLPKTFPSVAGGASQSLGVIDMSFSPASANINVLDTFNYNYLIFDTCATGYFQLIISNSSCGQSCVATGTYTPLKLEGTTCSTGSYTGSRYLLQIPIQKWYLNEYSENLEVSSYITYKSTASFYISNTVKQIFLSDEDYLQTYRDQAQLIAKLDSVATAISNMQTGIINNNNTNAQNIINNQNQNTNSINGNIDDEFNKLKNQDHTYNQNSADTPSGQNDINAVTDAESDLLESVNLDSSSLNVTLSADTTTWIWDIVTSLRSTNGKITLLFTSILSLAIIKMVLNR